MINIAEASRRLAALGISDLALGEVAAQPQPLPRDWFAAFRAARRELLTNRIKKNQEELFMIGLNPAEITDIYKGIRIPVGVSVKFRIPPIYGGEISPENMFVCRSVPEGRAIDIFIAEQAGAGVFFYPNPAKNVYMTSMGSLNSPGGNATSDRLSDVQAEDVLNALGGRG
ncbi:MAG: hypothetical protein LBB23_03875 [Rickettsiales bacterium]|jgi:hypothetical protein|nr:hypothetical protein [Rickettsiales bacterium]